MLPGPSRLPACVVLLLACGDAGGSAGATGTTTTTGATASSTGTGAATTTTTTTSGGTPTTTTGTSGTTDEPASTGMSSTTGLIGPSCAGQAIAAPADTWTWIDIPGALCGYGSATGLGINPSSTGDKLLIYLLGGGACFTEEECGPNCDPMFQHCAANLDGFDAARMQETLQMSFKPGSIFDRASPDNPFKDHHFVMVPYCTGDFHSGNREAEYGVHHVGFTNMTLYLERLVPTFCEAPEVVLAGSSAGGFGAVFNYDQVRAAFAPLRVDLIDDSGPPLGLEAMPLQSTMRLAWGSAGTAPADCPECAARWDAFFPHYAGTYPDANLGLVSSLADFSIGPYFGGPIAQPDGFRAALEDFADQVLAPLPGARVFYVDEFFHVYLAEPLGEKVSQDMSLATWLHALVTHDPAWADVRP